MKKKFKLFSVILLTSLSLTSCAFSIKPVRKSNFADIENTKASSKTKKENITNSKISTINSEKTTSIKKDDRFNEDKFVDTDPGEYGKYVSKLKSLINVNRKEVAITFSLEDGEFDEELYSYIVENKIKATVFVSSEFINNNEEIFDKILNDKVLQIEAMSSKDSSLIIDDHEMSEETASIENLLTEISTITQTIENKANKTPKYIRASTALYDEGATSIIKELNMIATSYTMEVDSSGFLSNEVTQAHLSGIPNGSIIDFRLDKANTGKVDSLEATLNFLKEAEIEISFIK